MERIILFMDHNEHVYDSTLGKALSNKECLNLYEVILHHTGERTRATFFRGSKPIDGLWASSDLEISNFCVMPFDYGVCDHQAFIVDIPLESLVRENSIKIVRPAGHKLNSQLPWHGNEYIKSLDKNIIQHHLLEGLHKAHTGDFTLEERARK